MVDSEAGNVVSENGAPAKIKRPRGRPRKSAAEQKARGGQKCRIENALRREGKAKPLPRIAPPPVVKLPRVSKKKVLDYICILPGYDPYAHWGSARYWFDVDEAVRRIRFFHEEFRHSKGGKAREPFILEPWQQGVIGNLFGWKVEETGLRRFREMLLYIPRKNGKTPMAAAILLCMLHMDGEPGAEIYGAASEYGQASLVFDHAWGALRENPALGDQYTIYKSSNHKAVQSKADPLSVYRVVASGAAALHGFNTHAAVIDELHTQPNGELVDALSTSTAARRQPLLLHITTADYEREGSVCNAKHDYAKQVLSGEVIAPTFLPVVYEATRDDDWTDEAIWHKANPNLGVSVMIEHLREQCELAKAVPSAQNRFKRLHLNIRTEQLTRFIMLEDWDKCPRVLNPVDLQGQKCWCGLDLASKLDFAAFVMVFPLDKGYAILPYFWLPKERLRQRQDSKIVNSIMEWADAGHIEFTDGNTTDYNVIRMRISELHDLYDIQEIAFDRWNANQIAIELANDGLTVIEFGQGYQSMSEPTKELERLVVEHELNHGGNPVMRWMIGNLMAEMDAAENLKPSKKASGDRIDGPVATIMGLARAMLRVKTSGPWADHGIEYGWGG